MKGSDRICIKVTLKNIKQRQIYLRRQENYIEGTPKIIVAKLQNNIQQIWIDDLKSQSITRLKQLNSDERAFSYARTIIFACVKLAPRYGFFIINQNMIFFNPQREIFAWINPQILQNHVKIYLPSTQDGQLAMIRSIITYLKLWLKCDYAYLSQSKKLEELFNRFEQFRNKIGQDFKPRSPERDFLGARKNSAQFLPGDSAFNRYSGNNLRLPAQNQLIQNRSNRQVKSPGKEQDKLVMSMSYKQKNLLMKNYQSSEEEQKLKNRTQSHNTDHISSDKNVQQTQGNFEHKSFHNINQSTKLGLNQSLGLKSQKYFPNRTTSNKNHPIVQYINSQNQDNHQYKQNKILLQDSALQQQLQRQRIKKMKQSLDGIGQQVNQLFFSNIESDGNKEQQLKQIEQQFESLLD